MEAFLALIENSGALVCTSRLHGVILKLGVFANGTWLLDSHLCFPSSLFGGVGMDIFSHPVPVLLDGHVTLDGLADKLLEAQFLLAGGAGYLLEEGV